MATGTSEPDASSVPAAWSESRVMPRPTSTACLTAPFEPSVRVERGAIPASTRNASTVARVPDPRSRSSQVSSAGSVDRMVGRGHHHQAVVEERLAADSGAGRRAAADRQVDLALRQPLVHLGAVADLQRHVHVRVAAP